MKEVIIKPVQNLHVERYKDDEFIDFVFGAFWVFNLLYIIGFSFISGPMLLERLLPAVNLGNAPAHQVLVVWVAILLPVAAGLIAKFSSLDNNKTKLTEFFFGVELPVAGVLIGRSLWANELNATSILLYSFVLLVAACQCWLLLQSQEGYQRLHKSPSLSRTAASAFVATGGIYLAALAVVFTAPLTIGAIVFGAIVGFYSIIYTFIFPPAFLGLLVAAVSVVVGLTTLSIVFYLPYCYIGQFLGRINRMNNQTHNAVAVSVFVLCVIAFVFLQAQANSKILPTLAHAKNDESLRSELLDNHEAVRQSLVDIYLAPFRYVPNDFGFGSRHPLMQLRNSLLTFLLPTLKYNGDTYADRVKADQQYEAFFDTPIHRAERESIVATLRNHWSVNTRLSTGLLAIGQHTVHVDSQSVTTHVDQGVATVTVQEVLRNRTASSLETFQYFTLPESAVITGLWLSNSQTNPKIYEFQIAPRGAAQQVYSEQVRVNVDPALLEMVGPRQYRLRVFPVLRSEPMVVTMTYKTLPDSTGQWPMPILQEQRHIFWDSDTVRTVNGAEYKVDDPSQWLPAAMAPQKEQERHLGYIDGSTYYYAERLSQLAPQAGKQKLAVLIDGSYSMGRYRYELQQSIKMTSSADLFYCQQRCAPTAIDQLNKWQFFGDSQPLQQLKAFGAEASAYDAVLLLTDGGTYESQIESPMLKFDQPVWLVELGDSANAYSDEVIDSVRQSGGDIVFSAKQAILQLASSGLADQPLAITSSRLWQQRPAVSTDTHNQNLAEIVSALWIRRLSRSGQTQQSLNALHEIAIKHEIVTPYSSMIVLVNDRQRTRLEELSNREDRFEREIETGKQPPPVSRVANAVPEPHEYALMLIALFLLLVTAHKQGWTLQRLNKPWCCLKFRPRTATLHL